MVVVGTYNMSFAGDKYPEDIPTFASEYSFHLRDPLDGEPNVDGEPKVEGVRKRTFWNNAKKHLFKFIEDKKPLAVGLQEMNVKEIEQDFKVDDKGGINGIKRDLSDSYKIVSDKVITNDAAVSIIYNENITGKFFKKKTLDNPHQGGRPLFMVLTKKEDEIYYLFVNMHGAQDAPNGLFEKEFNDMMQKNKDFLKTEVEKFLNMDPNKIINPDHIYIMGDFNDRYDYIKNFKINDKPVLYKGDSPKACCHNWDSMGKERVQIRKEKTKLNAADQVGENLSEKVQGKKPSDISNDKKEDQKIIPTDHGFAIADYINKGDKVFAMDADAGKLDIYKSEYNIEDDGGSKASDHELVYMEINEVTEGEGAAAVATAEGAEAATEAAATEGGWGLPKIFGGKRKSRKGRKSNKNKKSNRKTKKMARKSKKRGKK